MPTPAIPITEDGYLIQPSDIGLVRGREIWDAFGKKEIESEAALIIRFCQARNSWLPFTAEEFRTWLQQEHDADRAPFLKLLEYRNRALVIQLEDETYAVTTYLVDRVRAEHPANQASRIFMSEFPIHT